MIGQRLYFDAIAPSIGNVFIQQGSTTSFKFDTLEPTTVDLGDGDIRNFDAYTTVQIDKTYADDGQHTIKVTNTIDKMYAQYSKFSEVYFGSKVTILLARCFNDLPNLKKVVGLGVTRLEDQYVFAGPNATLTDVVFPNVQYVGYGAFRTCVGLKNLDIRNVEELNQFWCISDCQVLEKLYLPKVKTIGFYGLDCPMLKTIDFGTDADRTEIPTLTESGQFDSCASDYEILVPANLYSQWIDAPYWSAIASHIKAH